MFGEAAGSISFGSTIGHDRAGQKRALVRARRGMYLGARKYRPIWVIPQPNLESSWWVCTFRHDRDVLPRLLLELASCHPQGLLFTALSCDFRDRCPTATL